MTKDSFSQFLGDLKDPQLWLGVLALGGVSVLVIYGGSVLEVWLR